MTAVNTIGGLTVAQIAGYTAVFLKTLAEPTPDRMDPSAPDASAESHKASQDVQRLFAASRAEGLDDMARAEVLLDLCEALPLALPAMFPMRSQATYESLRGQVRCLHGVVLSEHLRMRRETVPNNNEQE